VTVVDAVIAGGGIMGCATALRLATGGMRVALIERGALCMGASGVNAGTLSIQIKMPELVPYAMRGLDRWEAMSALLRSDVGFHRRGGVTLAFTDAEAEMLRRDTERRCQAGARIEILSAEQAHRLDPGLTPHARLASHCPDDSYANASRTGIAYRGELRRVGVDVREHTSLDRITGDQGRYEVHAGDQILSTPHVVLATGAWLRRTTALMGVDLPVEYKVNQVSVTERYPPMVRAIVSHARALLTLKQSANGTVLIGGGWQGTGDLDTGRTHVTTSNLIGNLRLAQLSVPALARARLVRTWHGFEAYVADRLPLAGALPGRAGAYVLGCVRGGWTIGPYIGELLADHMLGRATELPLFDPGRLGALAPAATGPAS
jgi:glycine/D-amino acid oxidase-like deaminating enzyme